MLAFSTVITCPLPTLISTDVATREIDIKPYSPATRHIILRQREQNFPRMTFYECEIVLIAVAENPKSPVNHGGAQTLTIILGVRVLCGLFGGVVYMVWPEARRS